MKRQSVSERIRGILNARKKQLEKEICEWQRKMDDTESYWGFGGPYRRQEQALDVRKKELYELEEFERQMGAYTPYIEVEMYGVYCRNCGNVVLSRAQPIGEWHECPSCKKMIYDNNPERKKFRVEDEGQFWLKALIEKEINNGGRHT